MDVSSILFEKNKKLVPGDENGSHALNNSAYGY